MPFLLNECFGPSMEQSVVGIGFCWTAGQVIIQTWCY